MNRPPVIRRNDSGSVLILALGYLLVVSLFATAFMTGIHRSLAQASRMERDQVCLDAAEGGLHWAVAMLRIDPGYGGEQHVPLGRACFTVVVTPVEGDRAYFVVAKGEIIDTGNVIAGARIKALVRLTGDGAVERLALTEVNAR